MSSSQGLSKQSLVCISAGASAKFNLQLGKLLHVFNNSTTFSCNCSTTLSQPQPIMLRAALPLSRGAVLAPAGYRTAWNVAPRQPAFTVSTYHTHLTFALRIRLIIDRVESICRYKKSSWNNWKHQAIDLRLRCARPPWNPEQSLRRTSTSWKGVSWRANTSRPSIKHIYTS